MCGKLTVQHYALRAHLNQSVHALNLSPGVITMRFRDIYHCNGEIQVIDGRKTWSVWARAKIANIGILKRVSYCFGFTAHSEMLHVVKDKYNDLTCHRLDFSPDWKLVGHAVLDFRWVRQSRSPLILICHVSAIWPIMLTTLSEIGLKIECWFQSLFNYNIPPPLNCDSLLSASQITSAPDPSP